MPAAVQEIAQLKELLRRYGPFAENDPAVDALAAELHEYIQDGLLSLEEIARHLEEDDLAAGIANTGSHTIAPETATRAIYRESAFSAPKEKGTSAPPLYDAPRKGPQTFGELMQDWLLDIQQRYGLAEMRMAMPLWLQDTGLKEYLSVADVTALAGGDKAPDTHLRRYLVEEAPPSGRRHTAFLVTRAQSLQPEPASQVALPGSVEPRYAIHPALVSFKLLLRHWRESAGLSHAAIAEKTGVTPQAAGAWEALNTNTLPGRYEHFRTLAEAYKLPETRLIWHWCHALTAAGKDVSAPVRSFPVLRRLEVAEAARLHPEWGITAARLEETLALPPHPAQARDFGKALKGWMKIAGLNLHALADAVGVKERGQPYRHGSAEAWTLGKCLTLPGRVAAICDVLSEAVEAQPPVLARHYPFDGAARRTLEKLILKGLYQN